MRAPIAYPFPTTCPSGIKVMPSGKSTGFRHPIDGRCGLLVLQVLADADQQGAVVQHGPDTMAVEALNGHPLVPAGYQQLSQTDRVVAVGLVDPQRQHGFGVAGVDHDHRQALRPKCMPQPRRRRAALQADHLGLWRA
jgi:hypothetical protein